MVLSYVDVNGKRHRPWISAGLPQKGNKKRAEAALARIRSTYELPTELEERNSDMPFVDDLLQWLDIVKVRVKIATYASYEGMVKSGIEPYFKKWELKYCNSTASLCKVERRWVPNGCRLSRRFWQNKRVVELFMRGLQNRWH